MIVIYMRLNWGKMKTAKDLNKIDEVYRSL